jgi:hypothetical protein
VFPRYIHISDQGKTEIKALAWLEGLAISGSMALGARNTCRPCVPISPWLQTKKGHTYTYMRTGVAPVADEPPDGFETPCVLARVLLHRME